ncbi:hypothetical protein CERZMDRAFT_39573 [Cercospora zeae-maydis SCOH1-5]|uniref:Carbohydrate kinase PfkB domain-containing protein n=1 Tax=Cercospora zeae-maydis SCOH1-5 TaxID=717836 RepID=A0A6A6FK51_9PEZI|nr:hypothetical protein CERZMDRAFT_39573 [Cercospora zeae-maydis SCOH1-5]
MAGTFSNGLEQGLAGPRFVALGGVWLDEIRKEGETVREDVVGGSVTFATLGARILSPEDPESIRLVLLKGTDFPAGVIRMFEGWKVDLILLARGDIPSARGIVHYGASESQRYFERLTLPLNTTPNDLEESGLLYARCFHFFEVPGTLTPSVSTIMNARRAVHDLERPLFIWEPQAKSCSPADLDEHLMAAGSIDVFSPNHMELASFFSDGSESSFDCGRAESHAARFVQEGIGAGDGCAVIRCAEHGCLVMSRTIPPTWLPAYYSPGSEKLVDTTGAGNAFLGGFAIGHQETGSYVEAAKYGAVAASFVVEQVGLPDLKGEGVWEVWNGGSAKQRLKEYQRRCDVVKLKGGS